MFIHDELESAPGSTFKYTTFGYSLLSFILEKCSEKTFETLISEFKVDLGLPSIFLDRSNEIVLNRSRYYSSCDKGALQVSQINFTFFFTIFPFCKSFRLADLIDIDVGTRNTRL